MKVIDLLVKIANDEELPKIIKYNDYILYYEKDLKDYYDKEGNHPLLDTQCQFILNDEVQVLEDTPKVQVEMTQEEYNEYLDRKLNIPKEDEKIEHLKLYAPYPECTDDRFEDVENKINEIIDKINGEE